MRSKCYALYECFLSPEKMSCFFVFVKTLLLKANIKQIPALRRPIRFRHFEIVDFTTFGMHSRIPECFDHSVALTRKHDTCSGQEEGPRVGNTSSRNYSQLI
jgi:hypothetical protein